MYEPQSRTVTPTAVYPSAPAPLATTDRRRVVEYREYAGMLLPVYEAEAAPARVETVVVHRGVDPRAQILAAGGVLAAGAGWGVGQAVSAFAGVSGGSLMWLAFIVVALRISPALRRGDTHNHVTNNNSGFLAHSHTTTYGGR